MEIEYLNDEERQVAELLRSLNQDHIVSVLTNYSKEERLRFIDQVILHWMSNFSPKLSRKNIYIQVNRLNLTYPGGLSAYCSRAKKLLKDSCEDVNPYEGYTPEVPKGIFFS